MGNFFIENPESVLKVEKITIDLSCDPAPEMIQIQNSIIKRNIRINKSSI